MLKSTVAAVLFATTFAYRLSLTERAPVSTMLSSWFKKGAAVSVPLSNNNMPLIEVERKTAALFGMFVADAVAMPVHWMYNLSQLKHDYGRINGFVKPKDKFEGKYDKIFRADQRNLIIRVTFIRKHTEFI